MKTVIGIFDDFMRAKDAALDVESAGIRHEDISIAINSQNGPYAPILSDDGAEDAEVRIGRGGRSGAEIGGVLGLFLGLATLAIPGAGWLGVAGCLAGMVLGVIAGAALGRSIAAWTPESGGSLRAGFYRGRVSRGWVLVAVKTEEARLSGIAHLLSRNGAVSVDEAGGTENVPHGMHPWAVDLAHVTDMGSNPR